MAGRKIALEWYLHWSVRKIMSLDGRKSQKIKTIYHLTFRPGLMETQNLIA